ncbi:MAG: DUF4250 domain-containing protein [Lachnospiraceae bacterium]
MPNHPMILLSFVNMKLRDEFSSLDELCRAFDTTAAEVTEKLASVGYSYNEQTRQFTAC